MKTIRDIKDIALRSQDTLFIDAIGAVCLAVILFGALYAPQFM